MKQTRCIPYWTIKRRWASDSGFHAPGRFLADASAAHGQPIWVYRFDHIPPGHEQWPNAEHSVDVPYLPVPRVLPGWAKDNPTEQTMATTMLDYWTRFASTCNPNGPDQADLPAWQAGGNGATQLLDVPVSTERGVWKKRMDYHQARYLKATGSPHP
ncbi:MAG: carboxylesterase family protein [Stenotrophomonas sp.]